MRPPSASRAATVDERPAQRQPSQPTSPMGALSHMLPSAAPQPAPRPPLKPAPARISEPLVESDDGWARVRDGLSGYHLLGTVLLTVHVGAALVLVTGRLFAADTMQSAASSAASSASAPTLILAGVVGLGAVLLVGLWLMAIGMFALSARYTSHLAQAPDDRLAKLARIQLVAMCIGLAGALLAAVSRNSAVPFVEPLCALVVAVAFSAYLFGLANVIGVPPAVPLTAVIVMFLAHASVPLINALNFAWFSALLWKPNAAFAMQLVTLAAAIVGVLVMRVQLLRFIEELERPRSRAVNA